MSPGEIADVVDKAKGLIATPDRWCQNDFYKPNGSMCLAKALGDAAKAPYHMNTPAQRAVVEELRLSGEWAGNWGALCDFNNAHTHDEVLDLLSSTSARLREKEAVHA